MDYDVMDVAKFVVNYAAENNKDVTNMKLQKILYYLQGFSYIVFGEPLFNDEIEAWPYGPVVRKAYVNFSVFGSREIPCYNNIMEFLFFKRTTLDELENYKDIFNERVKNFLEINSNNLLDYSANELVNSTHKDGTPWSKNYVEGLKNTIPKSDIEKYFKEAVK